MMNPYVFKPYKILKIHPETEIDYTFTVECHDPLIGGQFFQVSIPGVGEAPISISDFNETSVNLTIRKVGHLTNAIFDLKAGSALHMRGPYGNGFDLSRYAGKNLIVIAGGTGLAPVKNVISKTIAEIESGNPSSATALQVLVGFKSSKDILFKETLQSWENSVPTLVTIDSPEEGWTGHTGLVTTHLDKLDFSPLENTHVVVVGPPMMMKFTTLELLKRGILESQLWVSFERNMSCGIGKCGHCKIDETYVCVEGPVFAYEKAKFLLD